MFVYALALLPLVRKLEDTTTGPQLWYADDSAKASSILHLQNWLDKICELGPGFGYFPEPEKSILVTSHTDSTNVLEFKEKNNIKKIVTGNRYLGGPIPGGVYSLFIS